MAPEQRALKPQEAGGFTLAELLVILIVLGLLTMLGIDSARGQLAAMRVDAAGRRLVSQLERHRERAERDGLPVLLPLDGAEGLEALVRDGDAVISFHTTLPDVVRFTANGLTIDGGTVVLAAPGTDLRRCLVMSLPLGIVRVGRYNGDPGGGISSTLCRPDPTL